MTSSRFEISNAAILIFLNEVGRFYDQARGYAPFVPTAEQAAVVLRHFSVECCYCGAAVHTENVVWDQLMPVDKSCLGLHAWGNIVPCCEACAASRHQKSWRDFLKLKSSATDFSHRSALIESFAATTRYDLDLNLHGYADSLYEDIGAVVMTLIQLRYKQAEQKIRAALAAEPAQRPFSAALSSAPGKDKPA